MRAWAAAASPAAFRANTGDPFCVWIDNSALLPGDAQHPNIEFWHFPIHLEGSRELEEAGAMLKERKAVFTPPCGWSDTVCCISTVHTLCVPAVCPCWQPPQQQVWQGDPIAVSSLSLLFTASSRVFFTSRADLGQSQGCRAKHFPMLSTKPQH